MVAFKRPTSSGSWVSSTCSPTTSPLKAAEVEEVEEEEVAMEVVIDRNVRINGLPVAVVVVEVVVVVVVEVEVIRVG